MRSSSDKRKLPVRPLVLTTAFEYIRTTMAYKFVLVRLSLPSNAATVLNDR